MAGARCRFVSHLSLKSTSCSGLVHWEDPEGSDGEGSGRGDWAGNTCKSMADSCQMYGKTHYNIVK